MKKIARRFSHRTFPLNACTPLGSLAFFCALSVLISGCTSMSKEECLNADWKMVGLEDGINGNPESTIGIYRKDCAKIHVVPNLALYQQGHREGVRKYCTAAKGYDVGKNGGAYYHVCPADLEPRFLTAYKRGQELYDITRQIQTLETAITNAESRMTDIQRDIKSHEQAIVDAGSSSSTRREHLADIKELQRELSELQRVIDHNTREISLFDADYQHLQHQHRQQGY